jgi:hypothetical protein
MSKSQRENKVRWMRFAVLGQIKYGEAALRAIARDPKCPTLHREAQDILIDVETLMTKYRETLK